MAVATKAKVEAEPSLSERIASLVSVLKARVAQFAVRFATSEGVIKLIARFLSAKVSATFLGLLESYICAVARAWTAGRMAAPWMRPAEATCMESIVLEASEMCGAAARVGECA